MRDATPTYDELAQRVAELEAQNSRLQPLVEALGPVFDAASRLMAMTDPCFASAHPDHPEKRGEVGELAHRVKQAQDSGIVPFAPRERRVASVMRRLQDDQNWTAIATT